MIQYEDQGPEARESHRPFIGASDGHLLLLLFCSAAVLWCCCVGVVVSGAYTHTATTTFPQTTKKQRDRQSLGGRAHRCGDHTALLSGGLTPPSVMPIDSPHESASGGNENSSGDPLSRGLHGFAWVMSPSHTSTSSPSQQNVALAFLFATPARGCPRLRHNNNNSDERCMPR